MKKILGIILVLSFLVGTTFANSGTMVGNDADEHGCIGSAGYVWNATSQKCERSWETKTYTNSTDFLKAEGMTCKQATDGCNSVSIQNGALGMMTKMYCEDVYGTGGTEQWSCIDAQKTYSNSVDFLNAEGATCKVATDGCNTITISNGQLGASTLMACMNSDGTQKAQEWSCIDQKLEDETLGFMSENDRNYYTTLQTQIEPKNQERIVSLLTTFGDKVLTKYSWNVPKSVKLIEKTVIAFETAIHNLAMKTPADAAMNETDTKKYQILNYAKFELQIMMYRWETNAGLTQMPEDYLIGGIYDITKEACDAKKGTFTYDGNGIEVCIVSK